MADSLRIGELDHGRLAQFRQALLGQNISEDAAIETFWRAEDARRDAEDAEDNRRAWVAHLQSLSEAYRASAERCEAKAAALLEGGS